MGQNSSIIYGDLTIKERQLYTKGRLPKKIVISKIEIFLKIQ